MKPYIKSANLPPPPKHETRRLHPRKISDLSQRPSPDHRSTPAENPFTYFERSEMIRSALEQIPEIDLSRISFSPFPIEKPALIPEFIPTSITCHTTIREAWNSQKVEVLRNLGYEVSVLYEDTTKLIAGTDIREMIRNDDQAWLNLVPPGVANFLESNHLIDRIKQRI